MKKERQIYIIKNVFCICGKNVKGYIEGVVW